MNSSIYSADRATHLRIVAVALAGSIAVMVFSISAHLASIIATAPVVDAGKLRGLEFTGKEAVTTRSSRKI